MARAFGLATAQRPNGDYLSGISVDLLDPVTNVRIPDTVYVDESSGLTISLPTVTNSSGKVPFYLANGRVVKARATIGVRTYDDIIVVDDPTGVGFGVGVATGAALGADVLVTGSAAQAKTGLLTAPFSDKGGQVYNVKAYGALGDGVTNDTAAFAAALTAAGGGRVFIPAGTYILRNPTPGVALSYALSSFGAYNVIEGAGPEATTLRLQRVASESLQVLAMSQCTLRNLSVDGGFNPATMTGDLLSCVQSNSDTLVENCHIYNAMGSCLVGVGHDIVWRNNTLENYYDHAMYISGRTPASSTRIKIMGNTATTDPAYRFGGAGSSRGDIKLASNVSQVHISGNIINGDIPVFANGDQTIQSDNPDQIDINSNVLIGSYAAIMLTVPVIGADNGYRLGRVTISGNDVAITAGVAPIILDRAAALVIGNTITWPAAQVGISWFNTVGGGPCQIIGNKFVQRGAGNGFGLTLPEAGSMVRNNSFSGCGTGIDAARYGSIIANEFVGCAKGLHIRTPSGTEWTEIADNVFRDNVLGFTVAAGRSFTLHDNTFINNTTTGTVGTAVGGAWNTYPIYNNHVLSGGAWPTADFDTTALRSSVATILADAIGPQHNGAVQILSGVQIQGRSTLYSGVGVPSGFGVNGDLYIRTDTPGTAMQRLYCMSGSVWVGIL